MRRIDRQGGRRGDPGRARRAGLGIAALALLFLLAAGRPAGAAAGAAAKPVRVDLGDGLAAVLTEDHGMFLESAPRRGEGLIAFSRRLCGDERLAPQVAAQVAAANGGPDRLITGRRYRVPLVLLSAGRQLKVMQALYPNDKPLADGWQHKVRGVGPLRRESLWHLSQWFTGTGENFRAIREYNELLDDDVAAGGEVVVPVELLLPAFKGSIPAASASQALVYGKDKDGDYAIYRLRPGEALYSSVVVRFTDRVFGPDVNALAADIARRSGIADVTDIPIGYRVKVPFDVLRPEFLPEGHPRRLEYEASLRDAIRFSNPVRAQGLAGITVILDAGHGGKDSGATMQGVWESTHVYDIVLRVKRLLETGTAAQVVTTTRDGDRFHIPEADALPFSRGHKVLTTPPYLIEDAKVGVNLRWYLANSVYRKAVQQKSGADGSDKVVFLSIHADSLHPSIRGAMAYIPAARMTGASFGKNGPVYTARKEVQEAPRVSFPMDQRVKSEGLSRELAKQVIAAFEGAKLAVHPFKPVREKIIRNQSEWVPAVLRYNGVPAKILLEVCNLGNAEDRRLLQTRVYRQKVAEAIVRGLTAYYGRDLELPPAQVAAGGK